MNEISVIARATRAMAPTAEIKICNMLPLKDMSDEQKIQWHDYNRNLSEAVFQLYQKYNISINRIHLEIYQVKQDQVILQQKVFDDQSQLTQLGIMKWRTQILKLLQLMPQEGY